MLDIKAHWRRIDQKLRPPMIKLAEHWHRRPWRWSLLVIGVPVCSVMTAYAVTTPTPQNDAYQARKMVQNLSPINLAKQQIETSYWQDEMVQPGDSLASVLARMNIDPKQVQAVLQNNTISQRNMQLKANQNLSIRVDSAGRLSDIQFFRDDDNGEQNLVAFKKNGDHWRADVGAVDTQTWPTFKAVVIKTSARGAMAQAGIPVEIRESLNEIFKDKLDLETLSSGDSIRLIYDSLYYRGQEIATGNIQGAEISHNGVLYQAYYYDDDNEGNGQYYDAQGKPLRKGFAAVPVDNARISSPFGMRYHPVLHTLRMHSGIDYAAPSGTPIHAPSDGVVEFIGVKGGYGNAIMLRHSDSKETLYGHMSAFAPLQNGGNVRAGDIIGYVGSTGRSTGPHLHYEVRINGQAVNPASVALPNKTLNATELASFKKKQQHWNHLLAGIRNISVNIAQMD
ncbi:M23 family metallopeptidase [Snodgrassella sp. CFCC 13594]|uniref:M23 family metallopeptidase n=1 Tax=Snodgrassella sp. CFCC 13594 TaxID=1775559 RepID=UPI000ADFA291|nr:peptidoglycan DD-metalloendopeptidase family protein [Snodgrassella sp. CFCC 13594]